MTVLCLCREEDHWKLIPGYAEAFRARGTDFFCVPHSLPLDAPIEDVLAACPSRPSAILHFESEFPLFPTGLERSPVPTVCFQADSYAYTRRRIRWSAAFDHAAVFHPGYEEIFRQGGYPSAFLLPHAARRPLFEPPLPPREFDVGWVGQVDGGIYKTRAAWLPKLKREFRTNDWTRPYTIPEVAEVYRRSAIVVNIGRDDFLQDANLRVFEVLASGALLITALPTELTELGFQEGVHFVGYRDPAEINALVRKYLNEEAARETIAAAARSLTLAEHTYDRRVDRLLARLAQFGDRRPAPVRGWPPSRARLVALDFFAGHRLSRYALRQYRAIAGRGFRETFEGASLVLRSLRR